MNDRFDSVRHAHRRLNPLTGEWVLVSPQRLRRPWLGAQDPAPAEAAVDGPCPLCPGELRADGSRNPPGPGPWVFANDFPALLPGGPDPDGCGDPLFTMGAAHGTSRVIGYSSDHRRHLAQFGAAELRALVDTWCAQTAELGLRWHWVQIFENRGLAMGGSLAHPHGQVWATDHLPTLAAREDEAQRRWQARHGQALLSQLVQRETGGPREVLRSAHWLAIVPFWAAWPFETLLLPRAAVQRLPTLSTEQRDDLGGVLRRLVAGYDALFNCPFPYSMGWHGAPFVDEDVSHWVLHAHFYPPLLRSATVRKFMVGYELLAELQRDLGPEEAAARLRAVVPVP